MTYSSALFDGDSARRSPLRSRRSTSACSPSSRCRAGAHILEIGCGWGGFAEVAARAGYRVTGISLSDAQTAWARERLARAGLADRADLRLQDYRDQRGTLRRRRVDRDVRGGRRALLARVLRARCATRSRRAAAPASRRSRSPRTRFERYRTQSDFIQQYIFPGGMLASPSRLGRRGAARRARLAREQRFGRDYARDAQALARRVRRERRARSARRASTSVRALLALLPRLLRRGLRSRSRPMSATTRSLARKLARGARRSRAMLAACAARARRCADARRRCPTPVAALAPDARVAGRRRAQVLRPVDLRRLLLERRAAAGPLDAPFALDLHYHRDLDGATDRRAQRRGDRRSSASARPTSARAGRDAMKRHLPRRRQGRPPDRRQRPGRGAAFFHNGRPIGEIAEPAFAQRVLRHLARPEDVAPGLPLAAAGRALRRTWLPARQRPHRRRTGVAAPRRASAPRGAARLRRCSACRSRWRRCRSTCTCRKFYGEHLGVGLAALGVLLLRAARRRRVLDPLLGAWSDRAPLAQAPDRAGRRPCSRSA